MQQIPTLTRPVWLSRTLLILNKFTVPKNALHWPRLYPDWRADQNVGTEISCFLGFTWTLKPEPVQGQIQNYEPKPRTLKLDSERNPKPTPQKGMWANPQGRVQIRIAAINAPHVPKTRSKLPLWVSHFLQCYSRGAALLNPNAFKTLSHHAFTISIIEQVVLWGEMINSGPPRTASGFGLSVCSLILENPNPQSVFWVTTL